MKTLTIKNVCLQVDTKGSSVKEVKTIVDVVNQALQEADLNCQPQIFLDSIRPEKQISKAVFDLRDKKTKNKQNGKT